MNKSKRLGIVGAGNMASAIANAILDNNVFDVDNVIITDIDPSKLEQFTKKGIRATTDITELAVNSDYILLGVKPAVVPAVLENLKPYCKDKSIITIAAGVKTDKIKDILGYKIPVVRVMPNMTLSVGKGAAAIGKADVPEEFFNTVLEIFSSAGIAEVMEEDLLDAVTGINGSSPAYFYHILDIMAQSAEEQGLDYISALRLAAMTMEGSAIMLRNSSDTPEALVSKIATPGGTTRAALDEMENNHLTDAIKKGLLACTKRSKELSKS